MNEKQKYFTYCLTVFIALLGNVKSYDVLEKAITFIIDSAHTNYVYARDYDMHEQMAACEFEAKVWSRILYEVNFRRCNGNSTNPILHAVAHAVRYPFTTDYLASL